MVARVKEIDEELNRIDDEVDILTKAMDRMYRYRDFLKRKYFYRDTIFHYSYGYEVLNFNFTDNDLKVLIDIREQRRRALLDEMARL
jgi:hypothetical protein|nr:MAG TPA: hypothetical protein [Caudoviricetes sp.]